MDSSAARRYWRHGPDSNVDARDQRVDDTSAGQRISPFAAGAVLPIAAVTAVLHCIASAFGDGYWFDEVYMLAIGRYHLDWGSADQPPLAPALAALMDTVAPGSLIALRVPVVLATAGGVVVAGLIACELGCDRRRDSPPQRRQRVCGRRCSGAG
jgi:hypothetical protein